MIIVARNVVNCSTMSRKVIPVAEVAIINNLSPTFGLKLFWLFFA
jgi:hypothetical protein